MVKRIIYRSTFCVMLLALVWQTTMHVWDYIHGVYGYHYGCINEMLVNYQGGLVRRGLFGELLFQARGVFDFSIASAIVLLYYVSVVLLTALLVWLFKKNGWSLFVLPFPMCLYVYLCDPYFLIGRRDCWLLLLAFLCYKCYYEYVKKGDIKWMLLCNAVMILGLLLHEASLFFMLIPIVLFDMYHLYITQTRGKAVLFLISHWLFPVCVLIVLITKHGDSALVAQIWNSWSPYLSVSEELVKESYMSRTMNWSLEYVIQNVAFPSAWMPYFIWKIPAWPFNLYLFVCIYYLVTRFNTINVGIWKVNKVNNVLLSNVVILMLICIFPFMLLVSCDWGRDFPYWVIGSLMFFHFFHRKDEFPIFLTRMSERFQGWIDRVPVLNTTWGYFILIMTLPLGFMHASVSGMFPIIPLQLKHLILTGKWIVLA